MNRCLQAALAVSTIAFAAQASAAITFYSREAFQGKSFAISQEMSNFQAMGRTESASSVWVDSGRWELCSEPNYGGRCVVLRRGGYDSLRAFGMNNTIASARPIRSQRAYTNEAAPVDRPEYAYRRRHEERIFDAPVTGVRAVMGPPSQRCWVERQEVQAQPNIGGAVIGGVVGGILGHQVGGGSGKDLATGAGAIAGAVVGNNIAGGGMGSRTQDVQRCRTVDNGRPAYWDVSYNFRGRTHQVQMSTPPGQTITVNQNGEPRY